MSAFAIPDAALKSSRNIPTPIGIGAPYMPVIPVKFYRDGMIDFVEITPEILCRERRRGDRVQLELVPEKLDLARETCAGLKMVVHGVQLSIGSAHGCNEAYLDMLSQFQEIWPFEWHSEHLGFQTIPGPAHEILETGIPLPLPNTQEAADLIVERCAMIAQRFGKPFLLENPAHYFNRLASVASPGASDVLGDEIDLMNAITGRGTCRQLLDLHNLYCNSVNHHFDPYAALDRLALDHVTEIHLAGGAWERGFLMDAHDSIVPQPVWELLEYVLPRASNVAGIVYEVLDRYMPKVGVATMQRELLHARDMWEKHRRNVAVDVGMAAGVAEAIY